MHEKSLSVNKVYECKAHIINVGMETKRNVTAMTTTTKTTANITGQPDRADATEGHRDRQRHTAGHKEKRKNNIIMTSVTSRTLFYYECVNSFMLQINKNMRRLLMNASNFSINTMQLVVRCLLLSFFRWGLLAIPSFDLF